MKAILWMIFVFVVVMLLLNLGRIQLSSGAGRAAHPNIHLRRSAPPPGNASVKPKGTVQLVLYTIGGIFLLALAWRLSSAPRVLGVVSLPPAEYLAYVQILPEPSAHQRDAAAVIGLFVAIATGLCQLREK